MYMYVANYTALRAYVDNDGTIPTSQMGMQQPDTYNIKCAALPCRAFRTLASFCAACKPDPRR